MSDNSYAPNWFFSREPLKEYVEVVKYGEGKNDQYWCLSIQGDEEQKPSQFGKYMAPYEDNEGEMIDVCELEDNYDINPTKSGKYMTTFYVPPALYAAIIGPRGSKLRELQENTNTLIKIPRSDDPNNLIKITGHSERNVASARTQIALIVLTRREKMKTTHFVSIPIISDEIKANYKKFKDEILNGPPTRGVDETIFQKLEKFHLTIVVLTLLDDYEIEEVKNIMKNNVQKVVKTFFSNKRPNIILKGLEIMNDDPSDVDVLYAKVQLDNNIDCERFQYLANEIMACFYKNGFVKKEYDNVKLHVTLMNSLFRKGDNYEKIENNNKGKRESFDAVDILEKYGDYYFGKCTFKQIDLSIRFTTDKDGYYQSALTVNV